MNAVARIHPEWKVAVSMAELEHFSNIYTMISIRQQQWLDWKKTEKKLKLSPCFSLSFLRVEVHMPL